jgi:hypothetical protein
MTNYNPYKSDTPVVYSDSPLKEYGGGRTVHCHNDACRTYRKTLFRMVLIKRFYEHETLYWTCTACGSQHISEHDI